MYQDRNCRAGLSLHQNLCTSCSLWSGKLFPQAAIQSVLTSSKFLLQPPSSARCFFCGPFPYLKFHFVVTVGPANMCTPRKQGLGDSFYIHNSSHLPRAWHTAGTQYMLSEEDNRSHLSTLAHGQMPSLWSGCRCPFTPSSVISGAVFLL